MSVIQAQWNLDNSSHSLIGIARGVLQAATTDNVQVLAILACERFGATLAISPETCLKIEREVIRTPEPALVKFLKVTVGYNANDCVAHFGNSLAGVQYLSLAAALLGTMDHFHAATAIQEMIVNTASDKTLVPTVRQVQDLLASIEPRCLRTGFADSVSGWQALLISKAPEYFELTSSSRRSMYPDREGLLNLVDAFRQLRRVGNEDIIGIAVRVASSGAAWTIAFIKWCLGVPPSVILSSGIEVLVQDSSEATVCVTEIGVTTRGLEVSIRSSVKAPSRLVESSLGGHVVGMIRIPYFGKELLLHHELDNDLGKRAIQQVLPYGLGQVLKLLVFREQENLDPVYQPFRGRQINELSALERLTIGLGASPFPEDHTIIHMVSLLFGFSVKTIPDLDDGLVLSDLPVVSLYLKELQQSCSCSNCRPQGSRWGCRKIDFWDSLSTMVAVVLGLSVFQDPDNLRVWSGTLKSDSSHFSHALTNAVYLVLTKGVYAQYPVQLLVLWVLQYVGHTNSQDVQIPLLSSHKGQAVWPIVYENYTISRRGYLNMAWLPGIIYHQNEAYEMVYSPQISATTNLRIDRRGPHDEAVTSPRNFCPPNLYPQWSIAPLRRGVLEAKLSVTQDSLPEFFIQASGLYNKLCRVVLVEPCAHSPNTALPSADKFITFIKPVFGGLTDRYAHVNVVAVDGNDEHRFLALASLHGTKGEATPAVLRKGSCIGCCLDICRKAQINVLIL